MIAPVHPWRRLARDWPDLPVLRCDLGSPYLHALTRWRGGRPFAVLLHENLTQRQARCAIAHECEHLDRGAPCTALYAVIEQRVRTATARYLLPDIDAVIGSVCGVGEAAAAEELWVTREVLDDRLATLSAAELARVAPMVEAI